MPAALTYPGVYIQEVPSGVRTITGVATSITAFVGRAAAGPICTATTTDPPPMLTSFADYERRFGGLDVASPMSYAVRDFYLNGGTHGAHRARRARRRRRAATITLSGDGSPADDLVLEASSAGDWGNRLSRRGRPRHRPRAAAHVAAVDEPAALQPDGALSHARRARTTSSSKPSARCRPSTAIRASCRWCSSASPRCVRVRGAMPASRPRSNVTQSGSQRTVTWIDADAGSGSDGSDLDDDDVIGEQNAEDRASTRSTASTCSTCSASRRCARDITSLPSNWTPTSADGLPGGADAVRRAARDADRRSRSGLGDVDRPRDRQRDRRPQRSESRPARRRATRRSTSRACARSIRCATAASTPSCRAASSPASWRAPTSRAACGRRRPASTPRSTACRTCRSTSTTSRTASSIRSASTACAPSGVNGRVVWGARTLRGADERADEYKYVPVRRLALFLEESLYRGTQWVVFEPNDEPLWAQIRLNVGAFMQNLFRQGAFQGTTPRDAYFVKCDSETTTQNDINLGHRQHHRRLRAAQAGRVRRHQDPADGRTDPDLSRGPRHGTVQRQRDALRPLQELQVPREVGRPLRRRRQQGRRAQAHAPRSSSTAKAAIRRAARKSPGRTKYEAITLERGVTHDTEFEKWANKVWNFGSGPGRRGLAQGLPQGHHHRGLQRGRPARARLQGVSLLGVGVPGAARPRRQRQRGRDPAHQARERRLGARLRRRRAGRADASPSRPTDAAAMRTIEAARPARAVGARRVPARARSQRAALCARARPELPSTRSPTCRSARSTRSLLRAARGVVRRPDPRRMSTASIAASVSS